jgi:hypothetical protein
LAVKNAYYKKLASLLLHREVVTFKFELDFRRCVRGAVSFYETYALGCKDVMKLKDKNPVFAKRSGNEGFAVDQLGLLSDAFDFARELTADFFRLGQEEARRLPIEVRTLAVLNDFEIQAGNVLAYIARYGYSDSKFGRPRDLYQVNLQDHNILEILKRPQAGFDFSSFLLYVLTHELIHVIRFIKFMTPFHQTEANKLSEEKQVHALTLKVLVKIPVAGLPVVLQKFQHLAGAESLACDAW